MHPLYSSNQSDIFNTPFRLPPPIREDPMVYLRKFFLDYKLTELRGFLEEIVEACLCTDTPPFEQPEKRADLMLFHKNVELLFEAAFVLSEKSQQNEGSNE